MSHSETHGPLPEQNRNPQTIDLRGLDKALVLAALYNGATPIGAGFLEYTPNPMTIEEATAELEITPVFDYLNGRALKVDLSGDVLNPRGYDSRNGEGAARVLIDSLREDVEQDPNNPTIRSRHLFEAARQAQITSELVHEDASVDEGNGQIHLGFDDIADELDPRVREAKEQISKLLDR